MKNENRSYGRCADGVITEFALDPLQWSKVHEETWTDEDGTERTDEWTERKTLLHPTEQDYNDMGWFRIEANAPKPPEGQHVKSYRHELDGNRIVRVYEYEDDVPVPRTFSKLKLLVALGSRNLAAPFLAWIAESGYEPMWLAAQDLSEGYEGFSGIVAQVRNALGITGETVEAILAEAVQ